MRFYIEARKWPHTKTMHLTSEQLRDMRAWLRNNATGAHHVQVRKTKRAKQEGIYSVVVYVKDDPTVWTWFNLTWV